jgi:REG-2-like HAD superfamily hydrolase
VCVNRTWKENRTEAVIAAMSLRVGFKVSASGYHYLMLLEGEAQGAMLLREGAKKWDTCAGEALLRAIGGCTTDAVGRKYDYAHNLNGVLNLSGSASSVDANFHRAFTREIRRTLSPLGRYPYDVPDASIRPPLLPPAPRGGWKILTVDVGGCLLAPIEPVAKTYARLAMTRGFEGVTEKSAKTAIRAGFSAPPPASHPNVRYVGDGKSFWRPLVAGAMGVAPDEIEGNAKLEGVLDDLYAHYEDPRSWRVAHGAREAFRALRAHGVKVAVVSNWDTRLPKLLRDCGFDESSLDAVIVSAEVMADKPDRKIFAAALEAVGASLDRDASSAVHVGDSVVNDVEGAVGAGFGGALMFAPEMREGNVYDFTELADEIIESRLES